MTKTWPETGVEAHGVGILVGRDARLDPLQGLEVEGDGLAVAAVVRDKPWPVSWEMAIPCVPPSMPATVPISLPATSITATPWPWATWASPVAASTTV